MSAAAFSKLRSLLKESVLLLFLTLLVVGVTVIFTTSFITSKIDTDKKLKDASEKILYLLNSSFEQAQQIVFRTGKALSLQEDIDPETLEKLLSKEDDKNIKIKQFDSWLDIGWINEKKELVYDWNYGTHTTPNDYSSFFPFQTLSQDPWKFVLSKVRISPITGLREIPAALCVTNSKGRILGYLCVGFSLADLNSKIRSVLPADYVNYVVLDKNLSIIVQSEPHILDMDSTFFHDNLFESNLQFSTEGFLDREIKSKNVKYTYFRKIKPFHMSVLVGEDQNKFILTVLKKSAVPMASFTFLCAFLFFAYMFSRERFFSKLKNAEKTRTLFLSEVASCMKEPLDEIILTSEILNRYHQGDFDLGITESRQASLVERIHMSALNLDTFTQINDVCVTFDVNQIVNECILMQFQNSFLKKIKIARHFSNNLPLFYANLLRFKQIIVGGLAISYEYCHKKSSVVIETSLKIETNKTFLIVSLIDDGLPLDENTLRRLTGLSKSPRSFCDPLASNFDNLEKLVHLEDGTVHLEPIPQNRGKKIVICLPFYSDKNTAAHDDAEPSNLISFERNKKNKELTI